jgi:excisionase family DNA binding protein
MAPGLLSTDGRPVTLNEAAAKLGLTPDTLRQQIHAGRLKAKKLGPRLWWVTESEVERYRRDSRRGQGTK